jgi:hypothetical protein
MKQFPKYSNEISALSFSPDGTKLAIGISYEHDNGVPNVEDREKRQLLVKTTVMDDCKVRGILLQFTAEATRAHSVCCGIHSRK